MIRKTLFAILLFVVNVTYAQIEEGYMKYAIVYSGETPEMEMAANMMQNSTMELYFEKSRTKVIMQMPGMYSLSTIVDQGDNKVLMTIDIPMMQQKKFISTTLDKLEEVQKQSEQSKPKVELFNETKDIMGYSCKKAVVENGGNIVTYWYTEDIKVNNAGQENFDIGIPGHPMEFETSAEGIKINFKVAELEKEIKKDANTVFNTADPAGYEQTTFEELANLGI